MKPKKIPLSSNLVLERHPRTKSPPPRSREKSGARVGANRKTAKKEKKPVTTFKPTSADYDARIFAFREKDWSVSLTLVGGGEH